MRKYYLIFICLSLLPANLISGMKPSGLDAVKEIRKAANDFYSSSQEMVSEMESIAATQKYLKEIDVNEQFGSKAENLEVLEDANRKASIKLFEQYVVNYPKSKYVADVKYRLGQLYFEDSANKIVRETEAYEQNYQKFTKGEIPVLPPEPKIDYSKAISYLKDIVRDFKDYRFRDRVLYLLGYAYFEEGKIAQSVIVFNTLVREFPKSDKLPEVYTRLGEYYFDLDDYDKSVFYYSHVLEYPDSNYYDKVLYKLAWAYYRKRKIIDSSDFFIALIDFIIRKNGNDSKISLKNEAKNYIAIGFTEFGKGIDQAYAFFRRIGGRSYEYEIMERICELYRISDRHKETRDAVAFILKYYPNHPENPHIQDKLIKVLLQTGKLKRVNRERMRLVKLFGKGSEWRKKNNKNTMAVISADELIEKNLIASALYYQTEGDKRKSLAYYLKAAEIYYEFLINYPGSPLAIGARHNYAQVLFNMGAYEGAIQEYTVVIKDKTDSKYKDTGAFQIISSWQKILKKTDEKYSSKDLTVIRTEKGEIAPASKLSANENKLVKACQTYVSLNPNGNKIPAAWYVEAEVYFRNNHFDKARNKYLEIISNYPSEKIALDATKNIVATYNYQGNYAKVEEWSKKLLATGSLGHSTAEIKGLLTGSLFKTAQSLEANNDLESAAVEYIKLAKQYPKSEYSDAALYNAGLIYEKLGKPALAVSTYNKMVKGYPGSGHAPNAMFRVAVNNEQQLEFDKAVVIYEELTKKYPKSEVVTDSFFNAARLRRANNQFDKAAYDLLEYHKRTKNRDEKVLSLLQAAKLYERINEYNKALNTYGQYITKNSKDLDGVIESYIRRGRLYEKMKKTSSALIEYKKAVSLYKRSGSPKGSAASHFAAEARFRIVNDLVVKYDKLKIKSVSMKKMKSIYESKEKLLGKIAEEYLKVVELGSPEWSVASLYKIGYAFQGFSNFLYEAPVPKELNTDVLRQEYQSQLQMQAIPFEDKAIEYFENAINESARLKVVNEWTKKARVQMSLLKPEQYSVQKDEESLISPSLGLRDYGFVGM